MTAHLVAGHRRMIGRAAIGAADGGGSLSFRRAVRLVFAAVACGGTVSSATAAVPITTDAERSYRELRSTDDRQRQLLAERWYGLVRLQEWTDASGQFKTTAKYVAHDPKLAWVKLRIIQGTGAERVVRDLQIPLERLSKACQSRVKQIAFLESRVAEAISAEKAAQAEDAAAQDASEGLRPGGESRELYGEDFAGRDARPEVAEGDASRMPREELVPDAVVAGRGEEAWPPGEPALPVAPVAVVSGMPLPALLPPLPADPALYQFQSLAGGITDLRQEPPAPAPGVDLEPYPPTDTTPPESVERR